MTVIHFSDQIQAVTVWSSSYGFAAFLSNSSATFVSCDELMLNVLRCHLTYQGQVVTNAEARFNKSHIRKVYACLAVTCHLHFWQNDRDLLRAGTDTEIRVSTESRPWRRKFSRRSSRDSNPRPFNHESGALTTELSPPPIVHQM